MKFYFYQQILCLSTTVSFKFNSEQLPLVNWRHWCILLQEAVQVYAVIWVTPVVLILTLLLSYLWWARQMKKGLIQVYTLQITLLATGIEPAFVRKEVMAHFYSTFVWAEISVNKMFRNFYFFWRIGYFNFSYLGFPPL